MTTTTSYTSCGFDSCTTPATGLAPVFYGQWHFENRSACDQHGSDRSFIRGKARTPAQITEQADRFMEAIYGGRAMYQFPLGSVKTVEQAKRCDRNTMRLLSARRHRTAAWFAPSGAL